MSCDVVMSVGPVYDALLGAATATGAFHFTTASSGGLVHVSCIHVVMCLVGVISSLVQLFEG